MPDPASATEAERMQIDKLCGDLIAYGYGAGVSWPQSSDQLANYEKARKTRAELLAVVAALTSRREQQAHAAGVAEGREQAAKERDAAVVAARHEEYASAMALLRKYAAHVADNEGTDFATDHLAPLAGYNDWSAEEVAALKRALGPQAAGTGREGA